MPTVGTTRSSITTTSSIPAQKADGASWLVYRDKLFPRQEYRRAFEALIEHLPNKQAARSPSSC
jgi:hypothetical protein